MKYRGTMKRCETFDKVLESDIDKVFWKSWTNRNDDVGHTIKWNE